MFTFDCGTGMLTTGNEAIESSTGDDTFTAVSSSTATEETLNVSDIIIDASTEDNDTLNLTWKGTTATAAAQIKNIENINVDIDAFAGLATMFNATNVTGATITFSSDKLGFNGVAGATAVANNKVVAGDNVTALTVAGLTGGAVDTGSASTVAVTGTAARANTITVNGDVDLTNTASTATTLETTADAVIDYTTTAAIATTVTGAGDVTVKATATEVATANSMINDKSSGALNLRLDAASAAFDATNFQVDKIIVGDAATVAATVASGQLLETNAAMTSLTINTTATTDTTATLNAGHNITTLVVSDAKLDTTINATRADGVTITTLTGTGEDVSLTGSKNVTVASSDVKSFDASAHTANLTYTTVNTVTTQTVTLGSGTNTVTSGNLADNLTVIGGSGVDTVKALLVHTGTIDLSLGGGNDIVDMDTLGAATIAMDGGAGTDTIRFVDAADTTAATVWAVQNFENIVVKDVSEDAVDALTLDMNASHLSGQTYTVSQAEAIDTLTLTVTGNSGAASSQVIDLSKITMQTGDTVVINGEDNVANTIKGTNVADTIDAGISASATQANVLTGGAGDDIFVFAADDSLEVGMAKITDFKAGAASAENDALDLIAVASLTSADDVTDVVGTGGLNASTIFADATNAVDITISDTGIMTLVGTAADLALADTLAKYIDIAEDVLATSGDAVAFEYGGNTYVLQDDATDTSAVIELTGVTGIDGLAFAAGVTSAQIDAAAAADTIVIA